jgi:hypothetical protein
VQVGLVEDVDPVALARFRFPGLRHRLGSSISLAMVLSPDQTLGEAHKVGGHRTKKDTVNEALREYIQRRRQAKVVELFGKMEYDAANDYKKQRRRP